ncbi:hypothetical protein LCGC14_1564820 [marine sediment metagenome]|uniref:Uncharacterized protein n=1 Tax=marine sediment metagenome TaxID=412755 RepID=A0A0F9ILC7_9ZZZZ|nr:hypothetical protein [Candidatus Scalindua sediminis]HDY67599.1 hypothetical protein [Candidatus Scalindua sp.]
MTYTHFKDSYRKQGSATPGSRVYERLKPLRTGIECYYGLAKKIAINGISNTYMTPYRHDGHNNVLIHIIELNIVLSQDFIFSLKGPTSGSIKNVAKWSDIISV